MSTFDEVLAIANQLTHLAAKHNPSAVRNPFDKEFVQNYNSPILHVRNRAYAGILIAKPPAPCYVVKTNAIHARYYLQNRKKVINLYANRDIFMYDDGPEEIFYVNEFCYTMIESLILSCDSNIML